MRTRGTRDILSTRACSLRGSAWRIRNAGQNEITDAAKHYLEAADQPNSSDWLRRRAQLNAGEMLDLLHDRSGAMAQYNKAAAGGGDQTQADAAKKYLGTPYTGK